MTKILFYYSVLASLFITVSSVLTSQTLGPVIFSTLFLPVTAYFVIEFFKTIRSGSDTSNPPKKKEFIVIGLIFLALTALSLLNIIKNKSKAPSSESVAVSQPSSSPLIFKSSDDTAKTMIEINITDGSTSVNVRAKPTVYSDKIGEAKNGESYELISKDSGWYKIKFNDQEGFIANKYVKNL